MCIIMGTVSVVLFIRRQVIDLCSSLFALGLSNGHRSL